MAHLYKRGKTWAVRISKRNKVWNSKKQAYKSKLVQKYKGGFHTKAEAEQYGIEAEAKFDQGLNMGKTPSFFAYAKHWYETYRKPNIRYASKKAYELELKRVKNYFADEKISEITRNQYQQFINDFGSKHARKTVDQLNSFCHACVKSAIADKIIWSDFTLDASLTFNKAKIKKVTYPTNKQFIKLLKTAVSNRKPHCTSGYMIITALYTGMREGEIAGLTWDCVDFRNGLLKVNKQWNYKEKQMGPTKTVQSVGYVGVPKEYLDILKDLKGNHDRLVFWSINRGCLPDSKALNMQLRRWLKKAKLNLPGFHFHSIRHAHAHYLKTHGINIEEISHRLRHANILTTENVYDYTTDQEKQKEQENIAQHLRLVK